ncbi:ABC transporter permease [Candidatus Lokiarchaeum ossiferum]|uniref:ABC transporter permease n=1 Tax=Candidatus Lokiarchaeum ossiferum TaxID=2951803 RepID=UPI00352EC2F0
MKSLLPFYFRLTLLWIKKSYLTIISISLTLAMIFSTNCVIEGGIATDFASHLETTSEFLLTARQPVSPDAEIIAHDIDDLETQYTSFMKKSAENEDLFDNFHTFPYLNFRSHWSNFGIRTNPAHFYSDHGYSEFLESKINFLVYPDEYYQTERFQKDFIMVEGRTPRTDEEVLLPYTEKLYNEYQLNDEYDLTFYIGNFTHTSFGMFPSENKIDIQFEGDNQINKTMQLSSVKIVGFYAQASRLITIYNDHSQMDLTYQKILEGDTKFSGQIMNPPVFFYSNFTTSGIKNHPVYQFYSSIFKNTTLYNSVNILNNDLNKAVGNLLHYGIFLASKVSRINFNQISSYENRLSQTYQVLQREFQDFICTDTVGSSIWSLRNYIFTTRLLSMSINLPLMLFTFFITYFSMKNGKQKRLDNFLQMSIKGMTKKQINYQMIQEIGILSIICTVISFLLGLLFMIPIKSTLGPLFFPSLSLGEIRFLISPLWIVITGVIAFIMISTSYNQLRKVLKNTEIQDIYEIQHLDDLSGIYDENSTYGKKIGVSADQAKIEEKYEDSIEGEEKKIPKISYFLFPFILIPIFIYSLAIYAANHEVSDSLERLSESVCQEPMTFLVLALIFPVFIVIYGFYRFLVVESPRRFARISKVLAKPLNKELNYLVGLEMIRKKEFRYIIILLTVFLTSIFILNPLTTSSLSYPTMMENANVGADFAIDINLGGDLSENQEAYLDFKKNVTSIFETSNISLSNHVYIHSQRAEIYIESDESQKVSYTMNYLNYSKYLTVNEERKQFLPKNDYVKAMRETTKYNEANASSKIGVIVGEGHNYYDDITDYPPFFVNVTYYNYTRMQFDSKWIECEFIARISNLPGIYDITSPYFSRMSFFIDTNYLRLDNCSIYVQNFVFMGNVNDPKDQQLQSNQKVQKFFQNYTGDYTIQEMDYSYLQYTSTFSVFKTRLGYSLYTLLLVGFSLCFGQGLLFIQNTRDNFNFFGNLLTRGVNRRQIYYFGLSQLLLLFLISLGFSILTVSIPLILALKVYPGQILAEHTWFYESVIGQFPILINWPLLIFNLAIVLIGSILLYTIFFKMQKRDSFFAHTRQ